MTTFRLALKTLSYVILCSFDQCKLFDKTLASPLSMKVAKLEIENDQGLSALHMVVLSKRT